ncbi:MFS transporter [Leuconostoc pseudomesenteroides]|uniref:MFS transporter n=1 Tax=Leuconostoc pseudomesenteroides TaxID=33968 RepID=UPI0022868594|nr:MFS transporter [Leuconostoc pseudomesenteroides]WAM37647.1 MFS transporter [Leuconostoc pseudomesenteroides]
MMKKNSISLKRLVPGLIIGPASWLGPYIVASGLFLPKMIQELDAANKVSLLALFSTMGMIVAALSGMVAGNLSDKTRSRFGSRTPWMIGGAFIFMLMLIAASFANSVWSLLVFWMISQSALNFIIGPMVAWIDFAPENGRGTASSAYGGLGMALGNNGFNIVGALFLGQYRLGFIIFGIITLIGTVIAVIIVHEPSNLNEPVEKTKKENRSFKELLVMFPSWKIGRDYYLALMGKFFQGIGNFAITGYLLYIMTDFFHKNTTGTQGSIQTINSIMLVCAILMGLLAGPFADKFKLLKLPVAFSTLFLAVGAVSMLFIKNEFGIVLYAVMAGLGMGIWNSLDNLLNLEVIPDRQRVAFFLGVYNLGNTLTQAVAPIIAAMVIPLFGYSSLFIVSLILSLVGGVLIMLIQKVKK